MSMISVLLLIAWFGMPNLDVKVTAYCAHAPCVNRETGLTKSGKKVKRGMCAADWAIYPQGSRFWVPGYGLCVVEDTGRLVKGKHLDLFFDDINDARQWGVKYLTVWRTTNGNSKNRG